MMTTQNFRLLEIPENSQLETLRRAGLTFSYGREVFTIEVLPAWYIGAFQHFRAIVNPQGQLKLTLVQGARGKWNILSIPENCPITFAPSSTHSHLRTTALFRAYGSAGIIIGDPSASHDSYASAVAEALGDVFARIPLDSWLVAN